MSLNTEGIIGQSSSLQSVFKILDKVAPTDSTVLVTGESGTGKELLVRALHSNSLRNGKAFVPINCGAIPKELLESELFGHEKGAFTHAIRTRPGRFELGDGGTVFLDEIGEMDLQLQVKILRVLQEKEIERVGGSGIRKVDVRIVAATNRDLEKEVAAGRFREDLYYRLNVIPIHLPPLRERGGDIVVLANYFLKKFCKSKGRPTLQIEDKAMRALVAYSWPGNVRELENFMERLSILVEEPLINVSDLPNKILDEVGDVSALPPVEIKKEEPQIDASASEGAATASKSALVSTLVPTVVSTVVPVVAPALVSAAANAPLPGVFSWPTLTQMKEHNFGLKEFLETIEVKLISEALQNSGGVKNQAAEILGIKRTTLIEKLRKFAIED